jgi:prolyl-tRNA editing enzyme YbaK/EbsC (Cys-tRNA(Pro) deacylase)
VLSAPHPAHQRVHDAAERKGVTLEIVTFSESTHTAADAARAVGAELGQIVKSLVFVAPTERGLDAVVALVSGSNRVDIGRLAAIVGLPGLRRASAQEAGDATGFVIGGIPPFGHRKALRVVMDPDLGRFTSVWAAAGTPNAVFRVPPGTLRILANAMVAPFADESEQGRSFQTGGGTAPAGAPSGA